MTHVHQSFIAKTVERSIGDSLSRINKNILKIKDLQISFNLPIEQLSMKRYMIVQIVTLIKENTMISHIKQLPKCTVKIFPLYFKNL